MILYIVLLLPYTHHLLSHLLWSMWCDFDLIQIPSHSVMLLTQHRKIEWVGKRQWVEVADYEKSWKVRYHHSIKGILLIAVSINIKLFTQWVQSAFLLDDAFLRNNIDCFFAHTFSNFGLGAVDPSAVELILRVYCTSYSINILFVVCIFEF